VLEARLDALRYELVAQMSELRGDLRAEMAELRATMERGFRSQTWRLLGAMFVAFGLFATMVRIT